MNLRYAFQDDENCFFVLDLMLGGEDSEDAWVRRLIAVPDDDRVAECERYILDLFQELDAEENRYLES